MNKEINLINKQNKLVNVKLKILNSSTNTLIKDIKNEYKKYTYINGYKFSHLYPKKIIGAKIENENEDEENKNQSEENNFNKITKNDEKLEGEEKNLEKGDENQISFINLSMVSSSLNDSKINQIINLPKLTEEDIIRYTKYTQNLFFDKIIKGLKEVKNALSSDKQKNKNNTEDTKESIMSETSKNSNNTKLQKCKEIIVVENKVKQKILNKNEEEHYKTFFTQISTKFKEEIQKEELNLSQNYSNNILEENDQLNQSNTEDLKNIKNTIDKQIWAKIVDIAKIKLMKDIDEKYLNKEIHNIEKINEIIIPNCIIDGNIQNTLIFYKNVIGTYKKYKLRTDNFINKRLFGCFIKLEEKYTDFMTTLLNEYNYFVKLNFEYLKGENYNSIYSIKKFKYDLNLLDKYGIKSKYDLFGFYVSNIIMKYIIEKNANFINNFNKDKILESLGELIKNNCNLKLEISKYLKNNIFDEEFSLIFNEDNICSINQYMKEFFNVNYINNLNLFK